MGMPSARLDGCLAHLSNDPNSKASSSNASLTVLLLRGYNEFSMNTLHECYRQTSTTDIRGGFLELETGTLLAMYIKLLERHKRVQRRTFSLHVCDRSRMKWSTTVPAEKIGNNGPLPSS
ncbi:hypothetical protein PM082_004609 [Marasmius tenuissimus]|nr:hypothetical protein PM082_004609 [Marasmius tenuissimus]